MSPYLEYLLKVSIGLMVVTVFYQIALRKFTFYNWNRWYLLGYSLLTFCIPFINIDRQLQEVNPVATKVVRMVPVVQEYTKREIVASSNIPAVSDFNLSDILLLVAIAGGLLMLIRAGVAAYAFYKIKKKARLISDQDVKLFDVSKDIMPFSFGNSIFINRSLHEENDLKDIILHEYIYILQKHTADILWAESICILNWYNPFAWMLRAAIRQNLEFIADRAVLENGADAKAYQYLLLKVVGVPEFRIASQFNFSSLKQRIMMMNKMKTAKVQLIRFLFVLPLLCVLLVAFRSDIEHVTGGDLSVEQSDKVYLAGILADAQTRKPLAGVPLEVKSGFEIDKSVNVKGAVNIVSADNKISVFNDQQHVANIESDEDGFYWFEIDHREEQSVQIYSVSMQGDQGMSTHLYVKGGKLLFGAFNVFFMAKKDSEDVRGDFHTVDQKEFLAKNAGAGDMKEIVKKGCYAGSRLFGKKWI
jgi:beta-lactamase regulating signal transducer with metallopeptidase domain